MARAETAAIVAVTVVRCRAPGAVEQCSLRLPAGSTLADALRAAGWATPASRCGIWGRERALDTPLTDGDRVEIYRELLIDPKDARRQRAGNR